MLLARGTRQAADVAKSTSSASFRSLSVRPSALWVESDSDRPPIVVPPTVLVQRPPEAWGEGR